MGLCERALCKPQGQAKLKGSSWEEGLKQEGGGVGGVEPQERKTPTLHSLCSQPYFGYLFGVVLGPTLHLPNANPESPSPIQHGLAAPQIHLTGSA